MRWKDNFYIYFSFISLIFIGVLIYYIYEMEYNYSLNVNTLLTVMGTVFGAYFGARVAGKYAISVVEKQNEYENNVRVVEKFEKEVMSLEIASGYMKNIVEHINVLTDKLDEDLRSKNFAENHILLEHIKAVRYYSNKFIELNDKELPIEMLKLIIETKEILYYLLIIDIFRDLERKTFDSLIFKIEERDIKGINNFSSKLINKQNLILTKNKDIKNILKTMINQPSHLEDNT